MKQLKSTVIYNPKWMKGIVGIVASRLIETYYRPTVVLTMSNGFVTGSARSVPGFDLYQAVESCSDLLENFGGHMYAAGLDDAARERRRSSRGRFNAYVEENIDPQMLDAAGGHRQRTALLGHHARVPQGPQPLPAFRAGQYGAGLRHLRRQQPRRRQTGRRGVRTPAHGPHPAAETQHEDPVASPSSSPRITNGSARDVRSTYATRSWRTTTAVR